MNCAVLVIAIFLSLNALMGNGIFTPFHKQSLNTSQFVQQGVTYLGRNDIACAVLCQSITDCEGFIAEEGDECKLGTVNYTHTAADSGKPVDVWVRGDATYKSPSTTTTAATTTTVTTTTTPTSTTTTTTATTATTTTATTTTATTTTATTTTATITTTTTTTTTITTVTTTISTITTISNSVRILTRNGSFCVPFKLENETQWQHNCMVIAGSSDPRCATAVDNEGVFIPGSLETCDRMENCLLQTQNGTECVSARKNNVTYPASTCFYDIKSSGVSPFCVLLAGKNFDGQNTVSGSAGSEWDYCNQHCVLP